MEEQKLKEPLQLVEIPNIDRLKTELSLFAHSPRKIWFISLDFEISDDKMYEAVQNAIKSWIIQRKKEGEKEFANIKISMGDKFIVAFKLPDRPKKP